MYWEPEDDALLLKHNNQHCFTDTCVTPYMNSDRSLTPHDTLSRRVTHLRTLYKGNNEKKVTEHSRDCFAKIFSQQHAEIFTS